MGGNKVLMFAILIVLIGSLNWALIGAFDFNLIEKLLEGEQNKTYRRIIYILVGLASVALVTNRDMMLPFLGRSAVPCALLNKVPPPDATKTIEIYVKPSSKVIYWASSIDEDDDPTTMLHAKQAYGKVDNSGTVVADEYGKAILKVQPPQEYYVNNMWKKTLAAHIHYRVCENNLMLGPVQTINLN